MTEDAELADIRRRKMERLQRRSVEQEKAEQMEEQKQALLRVVLTQEARQRLANIKLVKPEFAEQLELQLIQIAQSGRVKLPINDYQLKEALVKLQPPVRETKIRRV